LLFFVVASKKSVKDVDNKKIFKSLRQVALEYGLTKITGVKTNFKEWQFLRFDFEEEIKYVVST